MLTQSPQLPDKPKHMKLFFTNLLAAIFLFPLCGLAQDITVNGKISDADTGEELIGATIVVDGTTNGTATDYEGKFTLNKVPVGAVLVVSYTGYKDLQVPVANADFLEISLGTDSETLDEVIVVGYGIQEKRVATGAISKISAEDMEGFVVSDVTAALEGQVTGLIVNESSGQPGASKSLLIRGISTNGDNSPLYIIDGLQVGNIDNISPGDVESVDVLKDAASCAIYGARAANGVVIVTTKKGKKDSGGSITYEGNITQSRPWQTPSMLGANDYIMITREKFANSGQLDALETLGFPEVGSVPENDTDWMGEIFNPAYIFNHRLSANTKNAFVSLDYWDQEGVIGGSKSNYKRYAVRLNTTKEINPYITIGENAYFNRVENQNIGVNDAFGTVLADAFSYDPLTAVLNEDKQYGFEQSEWVKKEYINPLSRLFIANNEGHSDAFLGNVYVELKPIKNVTFRSDLGADIFWFNYRSFTPDYEFHDAFINIDNDVSQGYGTGESFQFENYVNYNNTFDGVHNLDVVLGTSYRDSKFETAGGSTSSIPDAVKFNPNWQILNAGQDSTDLTFGSINVKYALISYFGRLQYDYDKKYLFTATVRRDGSSNFGQNNRWGVFPSFSAGWVLSKEKFFNFDAISFLKLRASWGRNGSDRISPLSYTATIENVFTYAFGQDPTLFTGAALATPPNPNVKWEESEQIDIGVEAELWEGKVTVDADIYRKSTKDLLMAEVIPGYIGATNNPISNLGEIRNQGIELGIGHRARINKLTINTRFSYTHFTNEVINVAGDAGFLQGWSWPVRNTAITRMTEGEPVGHFVGLINDGIFQSQDEIFRHINADGDPLQPDAAPGDLRFVDFNQDGVINSDDITNIGSPWPDHILGLSVNLNWKGLDFSCIFAAQLGHEIFRAYERSDVTFTNYQTFWLDRWTPDNPGSKYPRLTSDDPNGNQRPSSFYVEDGSFFRLRNLQIGYSVPKDLISKLKMNDLRIYFTANNLITLTNYQGFDPDIGTNGWILDTGIDKGFYPSNKSVGGGVKVTF